MTVIVAVTDGARVCMASDSQATNNGAKATLAGGKIVRRGALLFGCGDLSLIDAVRWHLPEPEVRTSLIEWSAVVFVQWLRDYLRVRDLMEKTERGDSEYPSGIFVAHKGEFVLVDKNTGVIRFSEPFAASGSGFCEARGAMWSHRDFIGEPIGDELGKLADSSVNTENVACLGVEAAIALDSGCGPPVCVEWTQP